MFDCIWYNLVSVLDENEERCDKKARVAGRGRIFARRARANSAFVSSLAGVFTFVADRASSSVPHLNTLTKFTAKNGVNLDLI